MKLSLLAFSLIVLYWSCVICAEEDVNSTKDVIKQDVFDLENVPWERSLSRNKRSIILSPLANILLQTLEKSATGVLLKPIVTLLKPTLDFFGFIYSTLIGSNTCPSVVALPSDIISNIISRPIKTIETLICWFVSKIGDQGRKLMIKGLEVSLKFAKNIMLPATHKLLNILKDTNILPPSIVALIDTFNAIYNILRLLGYIP